LIPCDSSTAGVELIGAQNWWVMTALRGAVQSRFALVLGWTVRALSVLGRGLRIVRTIIARGGARIRAEDRVNGCDIFRFSPRLARGIVA
jgi:hypothetical protein